MVSATVTNALLTVRVKATDNFGVTNVEYYFNEQDYGPGIFDGTNQWSMNFALWPGVNLIQTVATDTNGNYSATNDLTMTSVNKETNADLITFCEHLVDSSQTDTQGNVSVVSQDVGVLNLVVTIPGVGALSANVWSNLDLIFSFGDFSFSQSLQTANVLTASNALFFVDLENGGFGNQDVLVSAAAVTVSRSGNTLGLVAGIGNPNFSQANQGFFFSPYDFVALDYQGWGGPIQAVQAFSLNLQDDITTNSYANISYPIYITGMDVTNSDGSRDELDDIQASGTADFTPPRLISVSPAASLTTTNGLLNIQVEATDNTGATNVEFYWNGQDFGPGACAGVLGATNVWSLLFALVPGTHWFQTVATDGSGNNSATNRLAVTCVNRQTNASMIQFVEHYVDDFQADGLGDTNYTFSQDAGILSAALPVPGLQTMPADTWSNLLFSLSFADISFSNSLAAADVLTATNATFRTTGSDLNGNLIDLAQLTVSRSGNTLVVFLQTGNPSYSFANPQIIANDYYTMIGAIQDQQPFSMMLSDGATLQPCLNLSRNLYVTGTNAAFFNSGLRFDNLLVSGTADFTPPTNQIIAPTTGRQWSNAVFTATGRAGDNILVTNVFCSVNNSGWMPATPINTWSNWTVAVSLAPGTNIVAAYAVDASGNASTTNTVSFVYVVTAPLALRIAGLGTVSPDDDALLQIGESFSLTATPASGFIFTNWSGGATISNTNLQFVMASNLTVQANFVEFAKPTVTITAPIASQKMPAAVATVTGTAADNWKIAGVWYQLNGGAWFSAPTTNHWTNWSQMVMLNAGTNTLKAYAVNLVGNYSNTNSVSFNSSSQFKLQLALSPVAPSSSGGLAFNLQLSTNLSGHIQYSTNLINWVDFTNFNGTRSVLNFRDPAATNSWRRFYRAAIP